MNYIWEIAVKKQNESISKEDIFYKQAKKYSPYYEQAFVNINEQEVSQNIIEINAFYRFEDIFCNLIDSGSEENQEMKEYLFDLLIHYLTEIDLRRGLNKREYYIYKIKQGISQGNYGEKTAEEFKTLNKGEQYDISSYLVEQFQTGSSILLYSKVIRNFFPNAMVYKNNLKSKQILIYIGLKQSIEIDLKIKLINGLFLPMGYTTRLFYEHHFGIMDVPETLVFGNIEIL